MILSMTGFGRAEGIFEGKKISIELKSLNSKSFDLNLRIPLRYKEKEFEVRKLLNDTILRGKVDCYINCETIDDCNDVKINQDIVKAYINQLREISPNADPPVAKFVDWGKFQYQKMKEQQKNRRSNKATELKQMRFGLKIGANDLEIKLRKIRGFLSEGHKVKILIFFRGREMAHKELGYVLIDKVMAQLEEDAILEQKPVMAGRNLSIVIRSK